ncbi:MAG: GIY-YIG nuclease family protein [Spirochaetes bacterium]|nr:GIY-YIG nuclease family protein [Spirochaetota bacterium]
MAAPWFVYILECENGSYYTGVTDDVARRFNEHRRGTARSKYTRSFRPRRVAAAWRVLGGRGAAMRVEGLVKGMTRARKEVLIAAPESLAGDELFIIPHPVDGEGVVPEAMRDVTRYTPRPGDGTIRNPYLEELLSMVEDSGARGREDLAAFLMERRADFISRYAFAVPTIDIVDAIARHSPIVEIGAGTGYWAMCLGDAGADVVAYDLRPPGDEPPWEWREANPWFEESWSVVVRGGTEMAAAHPDRALFLCWPPPGSPVAREALLRHRDAGGRILVFIGSPGSSADEEFFSCLEEMRVFSSGGIWSWPGTEERLIIAAWE